MQFSDHENVKLNSSKKIGVKKALSKYHFKMNDLFSDFLHFFFTVNIEYIKIIACYITTDTKLSKADLEF